MKKQADKLTLKRETIRPLTTTDLSNVGGGQRPINPTKSYVISSHPSYCCGDTVVTTGGD